MRLTVVAYLCLILMQVSEDGLRVRRTTSFPSEDANLDKIIYAKPFPNDDAGKVGGPCFSNVSEMELFQNCTCTQCQQWFHHELG
jgi:hypothetical protein